MNPNLIVFLRRATIVLIFVLFIGALCYGLKDIVDFGQLVAWAWEGFIVITIAGMMMLLIGLFLKEVWVNILRRAESINLCCPDGNGNGFHIISKHYFSGGDSGDGYDAYSHYYFTMDGKVFLSRKLKDAD